MRVLTTRELPPRARRILPTYCCHVCAVGTTSACAENTTYRRVRACETRNYLRVRGEYKPNLAIRLTFMELPPRARRIQPIRQKPENHFRNYLRVRGEYMSLDAYDSFWDELPPRARRILNPDCGVLQGHGTTSACAENTWWRAPRGLWCGNYLRVRGEYEASGTEIEINVELPPRARRIRFAGKFR